MGMGPGGQQTKSFTGSDSNSSPIRPDKENDFKLHMNREESRGINEVHVDTIYLMAASLDGFVPIRLTLHL